MFGPRNYRSYLALHGVALPVSKAFDKVSALLDSNRTVAVDTGALVVID
jgi:hypothetical protein